MEEDKVFDSRGGRARRGSDSWLGGLVLFLALACLGIVLSHLGPLRNFFTADSIRAFAHRLGVWGPLAVLVAAVLMPLVFLPRWPLGMACGMVYGVAWGTLLANVAGTFGAWVQFILARHLLAPSAERLRRRMGDFHAGVTPGPSFTAVLVVRLFPFSNYAVTNLVCGSLKIRQSAYVMATFLGMLPTTVMYASWGKLLKKPSPVFYVLAVSLVFVLTLASLLAQRRFVNRKAGFNSSEKKKPV